ncbi:MAG: VWA domain-containing protein [Lachnospiraceae bacterium]|nr:VWA domain-containing protein [Lachnospiraceae bacterium]
MKKKFDLSLLIACLIGGIAGGIAANIVFGKVENEWNPVLSVGVYFAIVSFSICLFGFIMERITRNLTSYVHTTTSREQSIILFLTPVAFFVIGVIFQFIYGLGKVKYTEIKADNFIVIIDNSGSTASTDPDEERFSSVVDFAKGLQDGNGMMVTVFSSDAEVVFPFKQKYAGIDTDIAAALAPFQATGGTNIEMALEDSINGYGGGNGKKAVALLFSDGAGNIDMDYITKTYQDAGIPIFTISFSGSNNSGRRLLEELSDKTGGQYFEIGSALTFNQSYQKVKNYQAQRNLLDKRVFSERKKGLYTFLRILFIMLAVIAILPFISYVLDSEEVLKRNLLPKIGEGLAAGVIVELGFRQYFSGSALRIIMCILMALILAWCDVPDIEEYLAGGSGYGDSPDGSNGSGSGGDRADTDKNRLGGTGELSHKEKDGRTFEVKGRK